jgi:ribosomal protein S18 acetylase RimI-like enzyme
MDIQFREMLIDDYNEVFTLWDDSNGIGLSSSDTRDDILKFLERNSGLSFVAKENSNLVGAVLCGTDGRRGYIHHLAVKRAFRGQGIGRELIDHCITALISIGIQKCHLFVFNENIDAIVFWKSIGWETRDELIMLSRYTC